MGGDNNVKEPRTETEKVKDPFLLKNEYLSLVKCLLCHSLQSSMTKLCSLILSDPHGQHPDILQELSAENKQLLLLQGYYDFCKLKGPLPDITQPIFLDNLHRALTGLLGELQGHSMQELARDKVWKLISGLRQMLTMALICSNKFVVKEVEARITSFFPVLPRRPSNDAHWESWCKCIHAPDDFKLEFISDMNFKCLHYFKDRLDLPAERKLDKTDWFLGHWNKVEPKLKHLLNFVKQNVVGDISYLNLIWGSEHPKIQLLSSRYEGAESEEKLIEFYELLSDLRIEAECLESFLNIKPE